MHQFFIIVLNNSGRNPSQWNEKDIFSLHKKRATALSGLNKHYVIETVMHRIIVGAPPGKCGFRLVLHAIQRPNEDLQRGLQTNAVGNNQSVFMSTEISLSFTVFTSLFISQYKNSQLTSNIF